MISSIRHKGLLQFYETGIGSKLPNEYLKKINRVIDQLDAVTCVEDIIQMGNGIHKLSGNLSDFWSLKITPNYRIIFRFIDGDVFDLDFVDYH